MQLCPLQENHLQAPLFRHALGNNVVEAHTESFKEDFHPYIILPHRIYSVSTLRAATMPEQLRRDNGPRGVSGAEVGGILNVWFKCFCGSKC